MGFPLREVGRTIDALSDDDDEDCVEHVWQLQGVAFGDGATSDYVCVRCGAPLVVGPGDEHPATV